MKSAVRATTLALLSSFISVVSGAILVAWPALYTTVFDGVSTDLELGHYAERAGWASNLLPGWLLMPANTFVNAGYVIVGLLWIVRVVNRQGSHQMSPNDSFMFYVFCWMSIIYGPIQCVRIVTRLHWAAVLDQWYTFPIFAWVGVWSAHVCHQFQHGRSLGKTTMIVALVTSILSYGLAVLFSYGFEVSLSFHIVIVIVLAWQSHCLAPAVSHKQRSYAFCMAMLCCVGFVVLKLADHQLAAMFPNLFTILSGHFWSKVADFLQIHYTCLFFFESLPDKVLKST